MSPQEAGYTFRMAEDESIVAKQHPTFTTELSEYVNTSLPINDKKSYQKFLKGITDIIGKHQTELTIPTPLFNKELQPIGHNELTFATPWGGVSFKEVSVKNNRVEKLLVVRQATDATGVLGFEYHKLKDEKLKILEGLAIFISTTDKDGEQAVLTLAQPGDICILHPGIKHGVIPLTNLVIKEKSTCDLDASDLLFIF